MAEYDKDYRPLAQAARYGVLASYGGLLLVLTLTTLLFPTCGRSPNSVIWLIHMLPLLLFAHGLWRQNVRTHVWLAFISLGYFVAAVNGMFACPTLLTAIEIALIVILFCSATAYIRWRSRQLQQEHAPP